MYCIVVVFYNLEFSAELEKNVLFVAQEYALLSDCPVTRCLNDCFNGYLVDAVGCVSTSCTCSPVHIRTCEVSVKLDNWTSE